MTTDLQQRTHSPAWAMAANSGTGAGGRPSGMELTLEEAAAAMEGELSESSARSTHPTGVSIDSRSIRDGEMFFAISGPRFDGHDFVSAAFGALACCAVVRRDRSMDPSNGPLIYVADTLDALQRLAAHHRAGLRCPVVAVTGSNGKTTTKDLAAHVLAGSRLVGGTQGNLNNHLGVPLTLLTLRPEHEVAVIEMGASKRGEIAALSRLAMPTIGVITNVGPTHLEEMGTVENVARAKAELLSALSAGGTLIVNGDDELLMTAVRAVSRPDVRIVKCGLGSDCDVRAKNPRGLGAEGTAFEVDGWGRATVSALGVHSVYNALMALAVGVELGLSFSDMRDRLEDFEPPNMRLQVERIGDLVLLNDSYNSNPASARAALVALKDFPSSGRRVAVLGDMLELGDESARLHRELGASALFVDWLLALGIWSEELVSGAIEAGVDPGRASSFQDKASLTAALLGGLRDDDVVLIKASRAVGMEEVAQALEGRLPKGT